MSAPVEAGAVPPGEAGVEAETPSVGDRAVELVAEANAALNGLADAAGLSEPVQRAPWVSVATAFGVGYVLGGGLFTPTTARLLNLGLKLASVPQVRDRLLDAAEAAVDGVLAGPPRTPGGA